MGQKIGEWVRAIGVNDPKVRPNNGWRRRFKTVGRTVSTDLQKLDFIQGHAADTKVRKYGRFPPPRRISGYEAVPSAALDRRRKGSRPKPPAGPATAGDRKPAE